MTDELICPRRIENPDMIGWHTANPHDEWKRTSDWKEVPLGTPNYKLCSYCGSMQPEVILEGIERELFELGPTDKNYKVYISRITTNGANVSSSTHVGKFYFQHFDAEQRRRFIELWNQWRIVFGHPGYFYVTPYFAQIVANRGGQVTG